MIMTQDGGPYIYVSNGKLILEYATHELHVSGTLFVVHGVGLKNATDEHLISVGTVLHPLELPRLDIEEYLADGTIILKRRIGHNFDVDFVIHNGKWENRI